MAWTPPETWTAGENPTATKLNANIRDNMKEVWRRLAYVEITASVNSTTATEASPLDVISAGAITFTAEPIKIEFWAPGWTSSGGNGSLSLWDASLDIARMKVASPVTDVIPVYLVRYLTPTAGLHTYKIRLWTTGGLNAQVYAGSAGPANTPPAWIAVWQKGSA